MRLQKIKVVQLAEDLKVGGLERTLAYIVNNLDPSIFSVEVWCIARGGAIADELQKNGHLLRILNLNNYFNPWNVIQLAGLLRREKVSILHSHAYFANTMGRMAAILARVPVRFAHIQSSHWSSDERSSRNYLVDRLLSHFTSRVIACSDSAAGFQLEALKINPRKVITIYNCTDVEKYANQGATGTQRKELGIGEDDLVIGSVGRLEKLKGHRLLLEVTRDLIESFPTLKLVIIGDGEEREVLEKKRSDLGLVNHVILTGIRNDVEKLLPVLDVYVQPTIGREGLPLTVVEAMAAKLPVVASDIGGTREAVLHKQTGILVAPGDKDDLARALSQILRDREMRCLMSQEGWKLCKQKFGVTHMVEALTTLYLEEIKKTGAIH
jgi:glycosyltransferase involved in cell wall biosynthesis